MIRGCGVVVVLGGLLGFASHASGSDGVEIVRDGEAQARIYAPVADGGEDALDLAIEELVYHVERMSDASLEVVRTGEVAAVTGPAIVLGELAVASGAEPQETVESGEGFRLLVRDDLVLIGGQTDGAVLCGVYELLYQLGCDWVMPGEIGEVIPRRSTITVAAMDASHAPDFLFRRLWYRAARKLPPQSVERFERWSLRQKGGSWRHPALSASGHVWQSLIRRHQEEFDADPTMLALVRNADGELERSGPQIETTHPRVVELFVEEIEAAYEKKIAAGEWTNETAAAFGIGPADGLGYSLSPEALSAGAGRIDPIVGELDRTDELILLANRILERVNQRYPNAQVGYYSYSTHADYPMRYQPAPGIVQIFAPINFSRFHSLLDENSKTQAYYRDVVERWSELSAVQGNPLIYRGYNWNLAENMLPYTKVRIWGEELPFYHDRGFLGLNVEATKAWSVNGPSDYVFMRLAWDASQDWRELLREYCHKAFGKGANAMERYLLRLIDTQHGAGHEAGSYHAFHLIYDDAWVAESRSIIESALSAADAEADRTRIGHFLHNLDALALYLAYHDATMQFDFARASQGYDAMLAHWEAAHDANSDLVAMEVPQYLKRFIKRFVDEANRYSSSPYRIVYRIPDALPTIFDPHEVGHRMNYHHPAIHDSQFIETRTWSTTWDAQGLSGLRDGAVWYRVHFDLPEDAKGQPIGLFLGGVEDEARVWINGKAVGTSGRGFSVPFVFDLTDGVHESGDNLLAIQVVRNSKANEIGLGGIIRPSFLFSGPQLERPAPKPMELRRVLPGGELGEVER